MYRDEDGAVMILGTFEQPKSREDIPKFRERGYRIIETLQVSDDDERPSLFTD